MCCRVSTCCDGAAQDRPTVSAKLVIACGSGTSAAARAVAGSPLGRGRVALLPAARQVMSFVWSNWEVILLLLLRTWPATS